MSDADLTRITEKKGATEDEIALVRAARQLKQCLKDIANICKVPAVLSTVQEALKE